MHLQPLFSFCRARAGRVLAVAAGLDDMGPYDPFCRFCWYVHDDSPGTQWGDDRLDMRIQGITLFERPCGHLGRQFVLLSAEGEVVFIQDPQNVIEKIPGAGIHSPDAQFYGRMENIRAIGQHLYACGGGGQIYRRDLDQSWRQLDPKLLRRLGTSIDRMITFNAVGGQQENEIYICGTNGLVFFWDGKSLQKMNCETDADLSDILVEDNRSIWICGSKGTLLRGNYRDGFKQMPGIHGSPLFQSMVFFQETLYLAASAGKPYGLFRYSHNSLQLIDTGLAPNIEDPHVVDAAHGVLWAVSLKDIVRFDGERWNRIDFPGNTPIR